MANKILPVADALKQLYTSLGGEDPAVLDMSTNTEIIQEIAKITEGGGGGGSSDPYPGYDVVIALDSLWLQSVQSATLIKGNYAELQAKALSKELITYAVYGYETGDDENPYTATFNVTLAYYDTYVPEGVNPLFRIYATNINSSIVETFSGYSFAILKGSRPQATAKDILIELELLSDNTIEIHI